MNHEMNNDIIIIIILQSLENCKGKFQRSEKQVMK